MKINGIEIPYEIIKAINDDKLVVFAGSGISVDSPSNLPNFKVLANRIGEYYDIKYTKSKNGEIEEFFGELEKNNKDLKKVIVDELTISDEPNTTHLNLLKLFKEQSSIRIITTNQDKLLETACSNIGINIPCYSFPALPNGKNFNGIIHIHGIVDDIENIIMTDRDYGQAYMLNGLASRFLADVFDNYVILFYGYSYNDMIIRYLTTAITHDNVKSAYVLTSDSYLVAYKRAGIRIIKCKDYCQANEVLKRIGILTKRDILDWKIVIDGLNTKHPPRDKETIDELIEGLKKENNVDMFIKRIDGGKWADFLNKYNVFDNLFKKETSFDNIDNKWKAWLISNFIDNSLLDLCRLNQNTISVEFELDILLSSKNNNKEVFSQYLLMFYKDITDETYLKILYDKCKNLKAYDLQFLVFKQLFQYRIEYKRKLLTDEYEQDCIWNCNSEYILEIWNDYSPNSNPIEIISFCSELLLNIGCSLNDSFSMNIIKVFRESKNTFERNMFTVIGYMICDSMLRLSEYNMELCNGWIKAGIKSNNILLQRIAIYNLDRLSNYTNDIKCELILDNFTLQEYFQKEELFRIVAHIFDGCSEENKQSILNRIWNIKIDNKQKTPKETLDKHINYHRFNWLTWLYDQCDDKALIQAEIDKIDKQYNYFEKRKKPYLIIEEETRWGVYSPIKKDELLSFDGETAYKKISKFKDNNDGNDYDYDDLLIEVKNAAQSNINWGIELLEQLLNDNVYNGNFYEELLYGICFGVESYEDFIKLLNLHKRTVISKENALVICFSLYECIKKENVCQHLSDENIDDVVNMAKKLWKFRENIKSSNDNKVSISWNSIGGRIAFIFAYIVYYLNKIPNWYKKFFKTAIDGDNNLVFICVTCGTSDILYSINPSWTKDNVLTLLEGRISKNRIFAWEGLLNITNYYSYEYGNEILNYFDKSLKIQEKLDENSRKLFVRSYTILSVREENVAERLRRIIANSNDNDINEVDKVISELLEYSDSTKRKNMWDDWIKRYIELRKNNVPKKLSKQEIEEILEWLLYPELYVEVINIITTFDIGNIDSNILLIKLQNNSLLKEFPSETMELLTFLKMHTNRKYIVDTINELSDSLTEE